jgi:hypothetical protein
MIVPNKSDKSPHTGIIRFNIFIHRVLDDGSIDPEIIECVEDFKGNQMANRGEISVMGFNKQDCISKVKKLLEALGENSGKE